MAINLITLAEYKAHMGITNPNQDSQINTLITKVTSLCKSYCRRTFVDYVDEDKVEVHNGGLFLSLAEYPILSVSSVEYSADYGKTYTALAEYGDFAISPTDGVVLPVGPEFTPKINGYRVTYKAGFLEIPEDLKLAVIDLVTYYLKNDMAVKSNRDAGSNTVQIEYITKNTLPSHIARVLDLYVANVS